MTDCAAPRSSGRGRVNRWIRLAAVNTLAALSIAVMLTGTGGRQRFLAELASALIFAHTIGGLAGLVMPVVGRRLNWDRGRWAWIAITATLLTVAAVGCVAASFIVVGVGLVPAFALGHVLSTSLTVCIFVTLGFGGGMTVYEVTRARLEATQGELRAREVERERAEKLLAEARLASLESRLHPHFLFNTLNAISALIPEDPDRAEKLVEQLAALLRFSLDAGAQHTVPLATEVEIVRAYLGIEEARLGDRLRYTIELPPELESWPVPPLALHTLVQNSVKHVAAARREPTEIRVRAEERDGGLRLGVWDDGEPFSLDASPPGHGLDGLRTRLAVLYGQDGWLDVESAEAGKIVSLTLPR
jgi:two-component system sensor histidine kinase AlgZ